MTTDGESANTGKERGLWKLLSDSVGKRLLTVWCVAHRSDLAMEAIQNTVPELKIWLAKLKGLINFFRMSSKRTKALHQLYLQARAFPGYSEIRLVDHLNHLISTTLHNLPGCRIVWETISQDEARNSSQSREAEGFLEIWQAKSTQIWLTGLMGDITSNYSTLQKKLQLGNLIMPDVITCRDQTERKLQLMSEDPFPGGLEAAILEEANESGENDGLETVSIDVDVYCISADRSKRSTPNSLVTIFRRTSSAIRTEIVMSAINFLNERLDVEQEAVVKSMSGILKASSPKTLITAAKPLVEGLFPESLADFSKSVYDSWDDLSEVSILITKS